MYGILGEDTSDAETLTVLVRQLAGDHTIPVHKRGFGGCGQLLNRGAPTLRLLAKLGCQRFIVCHDADGADPAERQQRVVSRVVKPAGIGGTCCVVIPVQALEAWILADLEAAARIFTGWQPPAVRNPEAIAKPKEYLERLSRTSNQRPRYNHATHNERMAQYLDLQKVEKKCRSFRPLCQLVRQGVGNI